LQFRGDAQDRLQCGLDQHTSILSKFPELAAL
jgi:hypothetical protein